MTPPAWSKVATRLVELAVPVPMLRKERFIVTVSFGSTTPLVGAQVSETSVAPAGPMLGEKSSFRIVPTPWLLLKRALTEADRLTKNVWLDRFKVLPITATASCLLV